MPDCQLQALTFTSHTHISTFTKGLNEIKEASKQVFLSELPSKEAKNMSLKSS
jgi:hypothetical protein